MMIRAKDISFHYDPAHKINIPDIALGAGEELLVLGPSGSGKTTVLNILGGLLKPIQGTVKIADSDIYRLKGAQLDKFRGAHIGMIFQKPHILAPLTVQENLELAQYFSGKLDKSKITRILKDLGIGSKSRSKIHSLSEGEAQRVSIARALVNDPAVILADEPTASLDDENAALVVQMLKDQAQKSNAALIIVTHDQRVKNHVSNHIMMGGSR